MTVTLLCYIVTHWLLLGRYTTVVIYISTVVIYIIFLQLTVSTNITIMTSKHCKQQSRHENATAGDDVLRHGGHL